MANASNLDSMDDSKIELNSTIFKTAEKISEKIGLAYGGVKSSLNYADNVVLQAERGHGFAAEKANHLYDKFTGKDATIVGGDNAKNGADRLVNGVKIQTKYCASGSKCVSECFDDSGSFRYRNLDGSPMQIEVPSNKYDDAVKAMKVRIEKGQVPGVKNPEEANNIVRKGNFTYEQARLIAKAGTVESLYYDAANGVQLAANAGGISSAISFAVSIWNGDDFEVALESACYSGLKVGGIAYVTSIISAQVGRTGIEQSLRGTTDWVVRQIGPKASSWIASGMGSTGKSLYGAAAANNVSKLLRGNAVTAAISTVVLSSVDLCKMFDGRISEKQLLKNVSHTAAGVVGGIGGWQAGAAAGAAIGSFIPFVGTVVGGFIGGLAGSFAGGAVTQNMSKAVLDELIEDDAVEMSNILEGVFVELSQMLLVGNDEAEIIISKLQETDLPEKLTNMFASPDKEAYACKLLEPIFADVIKNRKRVTLPTGDQILKEVGKIIEETAHNAEVEEESLEIKNKLDAIRLIFKNKTEITQKFIDELSSEPLITEFHLRKLAGEISSKQYGTIAEIKENWNSLNFQLSILTECDNYQKLIFDIKVDLIIQAISESIEITDEIRSNLCSDPKLPEYKIRLLADDLSRYKKGSITIFKEKWNKLGLPVLILTECEGYIDWLDASVQKNKIDVGIILKNWEINSSLAKYKETIDIGLGIDYDSMVISQCSDIFDNMILKKEFDSAALNKVNKYYMDFIINNNDANKKRVVELKNKFDIAKNKILKQELKEKLLPVLSSKMNPNDIANVIALLKIYPKLEANEIDRLICDIMAKRKIEFEIICDQLAEVGFDKNDIYNTYHLNESEIASNLKSCSAIEQNQFYLKPNIKEKLINSFVKKLSKKLNIVLENENIFALIMQPYLFFSSGYGVGLTKSKLYFVNKTCGYAIDYADITQVAITDGSNKASKKLSVLLKSDIEIELNNNLNNKNDGAGGVEVFAALLNQLINYNRNGLHSVNAGTTVRKESFSGTTIGAATGLAVSGQCALSPQFRVNTERVESKTNVDKKVKVENDASNKTVGFFLAIGFLIFPPLSFMTFRKGYSFKARIYPVCLLLFTALIIAAGISAENDKKKIAQALLRADVPLQQEKKAPLDKPDVNIIDKNIPSIPPAEKSSSVNQQQATDQQTVDNNAHNTAPAAKTAPVKPQQASEQQTTFSPSFDCNKASTDAEKMICSNKDLAQSDVQLTKVYKAAASNLNKRKILIKEQRNWIRTQRDTSLDATAMLQVYQERIAQLSRW